MKKIICIFILTSLTIVLSAQDDVAKPKLIKMESVSPNIFVQDLQKTIDFYEILGFEVKAKAPDDDPVFVLMTCGKTTFMFQTFSSIGNELPNVSREDGGSLMLYIEMTGIRTFHDSIKDKIMIYKGLEKTFYGATEFSIIDNNNYLLTFAEQEN